MSRKIQPEVETFARIKVVGVGGSGCNAINHMIESKIKGVEFMAVNTDAQDLHHSKAKKKDSYRKKSYQRTWYWHGSRDRATSC